MQQCERLKADGERCKGRALPGGTLCAFHTPDAADNRRKGGKARSKPAAVLGVGTPDVRLRDLGDVARLLGRTINDVRKGIVDVKVANAVGYLCSVLLRGLESADLAGRVAALEERNKVKGAGKCRSRAG
jgi:hypothetical protein